jgi:hypothetical protein
MLVGSIILALIGLNAYTLYILFYAGKTKTPKADTEIDSKKKDQSLKEYKYQYKNIKDE